MHSGDIPATEPKLMLNTSVSTMLRWYTDVVLVTGMGIMSEEWQQGCGNKAKSQI